MFPRSSRISRIAAGILAATGHPYHVRWMTSKDVPVAEEISGATGRPVSEKHILNMLSAKTANNSNIGMVVEDESGLYVIGWMILELLPDAIRIQHLYPGAGGKAHGALIDKLKSKVSTRVRRYLFYESSAEDEQTNVNLREAGFKSLSGMVGPEEAARIKKEKGYDPDGILLIYPPNPDFIVNMADSPMKGFREPAVRPPPKPSLKELQEGEFEPYEEWYPGKGEEDDDKGGLM